MYLHGICASSTDDRMSPIASDIKLETESDFSSDDDLPSRIDMRYQPKIALKTAMSDWLAEIHSRREPPRQPFPRAIPTFLPGPLPPGPPGVPLCPPPGPPVLLPPTPPPVSPPGIPSCPPGNPAIPPGVKPISINDPPPIENIPLAAPPCLDPTELQAPSTPPENYMPASPPAGLPLPDVIKTCLTPSFTTNTISTSGVTPLSTICSSAHAPEPIPTFLQPPSLPVNSLSDMSQSNGTPILDVPSTADGGAEPMEVAAPCSSESTDGVPSSADNIVNNHPSSKSNTPTLEKQNSSDSLMQIESEANDKKEDEENISDDKNDVDYVFSEEDALLLADLFYMPFEHGSHGLFFLQRLYWLRNNVHTITDTTGKKRNSFEVKWNSESLR